uniref:Thaumatin-like protein n=1 Tax=Globodera pallida TaxID=36090 RepID=A0A183CMY2_GLOPA
MSTDPLAAILGENAPEKENNGKPRQHKRIPALLSEVQTEHALTRETVKEMVQEAIEALKAKLVPKMEAIAESVVRIADALEEAEARGVFEKMSLEDGPEPEGELPQEEERDIEQPPNENDSQIGQGAKRGVSNGCHARENYGVRGGYRGNPRGYANNNHYGRGGHYNGHRGGHGNVEPQAQARRFYNMRRRGNCAGPSTSGGACHYVTFWMYNQCGKDLMVGGTAPGTVLNNGISKALISANSAAARIWFNKDYYNGQTLDNAQFYDVSYVDGFNVPISVLVKDCPGVRIASNFTFNSLLASLPIEMKKDMTYNNGQDLVGVQSVCNAYGTDVVCCRNAYGVPATCKPSAEHGWTSDQLAGYNTMHATFPDTYNYAYDDQNATKVCHGATEFHIGICTNLKF